MVVRRIAAALLIVLGVVLMVLATDTVDGIVLVTIGISVELLGIMLEKRIDADSHGK